MSPNRVCGLAALAAVLTTTAPARAEPVRLLSGDGVVLAGRYTPGRDGSRSPAVIILDDIGPDADPKRCDALAAALAADGCAVLCLDFRGQGGSTKVSPGFWSLADNRTLVKGGGRERETISFDDFLPGYVPALANDVAAAKALLTLRHDLGECNVGQTVVIGFGSGATVGALWAAAEWHRFRVYPGFPDRLTTEPDGRDLAGCVWVDPADRFRRGPVPRADWVRATAARRHTLTGWLYPAADKTAARLAEKLEGELNKGKDRIVVAEPAVADGPPAVAQVVRLVKSMRDTNPQPRWSGREFTDRKYTWVLPGGPPVLAKAQGDDWFFPLPVARLPRR